MRTNIGGCPLTFKCVRYIASTLTSTLTFKHTHTLYTHHTHTNTNNTQHTSCTHTHTSHIIYISHSHKQYTTYITHSQTYIPHSHIHTWMNNDIHQQISVYWKRSSCIYTGHYVAAGNDQAPSLLAKCITFYFNITQFVFLDVCVFTYVHWVLDFQSLRSQTTCPFHAVPCSFHSSETATSSLDCFLCSLSLLHNFKIIDLLSVDYFFLITYWFLPLRIL